MFTETHTTPESIVAQCEIPDQKFFNPLDLADLFDVSRSTIYSLIEEQTLPALKIRGSVRVPRFAVIAYLEKQVVQSAE